MLILHTDRGAEAVLTFRPFSESSGLASRHCLELNDFSSGCPSSHIRTADHLNKSLPLLGFT